MNLGTIYTLGKDVPQDYAQALKWLRLAAGQENDVAAQAIAQVKLGGCTQTAKAYRLAAEQGRYEGQVQLGVMYTQGRGLPQDYVQAYRWLSRAQVPASDHNLRDLVAKLLAEVASKLTPEQAQAEGWQPKPGEAIVLSVENELNINGDVALWQNGEARVESYRLVAEGVHKSAPNSFASLYSCVVPPQH